MFNIWLDGLPVWSRKLVIYSDNDNDRLSVLATSFLMEHIIMSCHTSSMLLHCKLRCLAIPALTLECPPNKTCLLIHDFQFVPHSALHLIQATPAGRGGGGKGCGGSSSAKSHRGGLDRGTEEQEEQVI